MIILAMNCFACQKPHLKKKILLFFGRACQLFTLNLEVSAGPKGGPTGGTQVGQEGMEFLEFGCARRWAYGGSDAPSSALGCHGMPQGG